MTIKVTVSQEAELEPLEVPKTVFQHPLIGKEQGTNLLLEELGQVAADKLIEDFLRRFYVEAKLRNPFVQQSWRRSQ